MDIMLKFMSKYLLLCPDLSPPSFYLLKKLIKVPKVEEHEVHACMCGPHPTLCKNVWSQHAEDLCHKCGLKRFYRDWGGKLQPVRQYYYFGLQNTVAAMFKYPEFVQAFDEATNTPNDVLDKEDWRNWSYYK